jgi:hypothetical protein
MTVPLSARAKQYAGTYLVVGRRRRADVQPNSKQSWAPIRGKFSSLFIRHTLRAPSQPSLQTDDRILDTSAIN